MRHKQCRLYLAMCSALKKTPTFKGLKDFHNDEKARAKEWKQWNISGITR